jgi:broad specificity phosphatase PhoE
MAGLILLVRHGETAWSREARLTGRTDLPLTEVGVQEAVQAGRLLPSLLAISDTPVTSPMALCSPMVRARSSAELAALPVPISLVDELREADFGNFEGLTTAEIHRRFPGWHYWRDGCPGGESLARLRQRLEMIERMARNADRPVVLFGHGVAHRALICMMTGVPLDLGDAMVFDSGAVAVLHATHDDRFRLHLHRLPG